MAQPRRMVRLLQGDVGSGKTRRRADGDADRDRGRRPGGIDGADRDPRPPASRDTAAPRRAGRVEIGFLTGREKGRARASMLASLASGLTPAVVGTHALLPAGCRVPRSRPRRHRRAAPLRRRAAPGARRQGPRRRHLADERDADPAHPDDDRLWRSRRLAPDRKAAGAPAGRYPRPWRWSASTTSSRRSAAPWRAGRQGLLDLPDGRGERDRRSRRRRGAPHRRSRRCSPAASGWCMAA